MLAATPVKIELPPLFYFMLIFGRDGQKSHKSSDMGFS
jgi:hypothetical protein